MSDVGKLSTNTSIYNTGLLLLVDVSDVSQDVGAGMNGVGSPDWAIGECIYSGGFFGMIKCNWSPNGWSWGERFVQIRWLARSAMVPMAFEKIVRLKLSY